MGTVLKVGPGKVGPGGNRLPMDVKVGDRVMFKRKPGSALVPDRRETDDRGWKDLLVLTEDDILLILEP
jgi:co-chaperonin GroES (HSP10)